MRWLLDIDPNGSFWRFTRGVTVVFAVIMLSDQLTSMPQWLVYTCVIIAVAAGLFAYVNRGRLVQ